MAYLLTHSLLSSWLYALKGNPYEDATTERDPMAEFMMALRREQTPPTEAMQKGIEFEDLVTAIVEGKESFGFFEISDNDGMPGLAYANIADHKWYTVASKVAQRVRGGVLQYKAKKLLVVDGFEILLYGRLDCLKAGEVIDIKFSTSYDRGKYIDSTQHPTYLELVPEAHTFTYLVSNGTEVWTEPYRREDTPSIIPVISDFLKWLSATGLLELYKEHWASK